MSSLTEILKKWDQASLDHIFNSVLQITKHLINKEDLVIVDVGANSGAFFDLLCKNVRIKKAILFEPQPQLYQYLVEKYKDDDRIIVENIALSDGEKGYTLFDDAFYESVNNHETVKHFNLGLSYVKYESDSQLRTNSFDNLRKKYNLDKIDVIKIDTETEDLLVLKGFTETVKELKHKPLIEFESNWWIKYTYDESKKLLDDFCSYNNYVNEIDLNLKEDFFLKPKSKSYNNKITIVTGLWDLNRGSLGGWARRDFQQYKERFFELLEADVPMCVWIPRNLENEVLKIRKDRPTKIFFKELEDFKTWFPFFDKLQEIRTNPNWFNIAGWVPESPQAALEYYNPMMMCKMFMVNDSAIVNPFDSEYFYWIDGGLTSTVNQGYFTKHNVLSKLDIYTDSVDKLTFLTYPYLPDREIHGFEKDRFADWCSIKDYNDFHISRGGFWGGKKEHIHELNKLYYSVLQDTILSGDMGADECLFTILTYKNPDLIEPFRIEGNGLVWPFFEHLNNLTEKDRKPLKKVALYVIGFNFPSQFEKLCISFEKYDEDFLLKPEKILLNNSTDRSTDSKFDELCKKYGFKEVKKDNIGICGGRQWCAEHAEENGFDFYFFFEDDMFFYLGNDEFCRNGFRRKIPNLYNLVIQLTELEKFDFLKWNFTEVFGDNSKQWAWHNIPQDVREKYFPENPVKTDGNVEKAPYTKYKNIKSYKGLPYATGEIFYCNWPQVVSKKGNKKMFLDVKWDRPYEQTWMSYIYQETVKNNINPGILLATPTEHNRFEYYSANERREN